MLSLFRVLVFPARVLLALDRIPLLTGCSPLVPPHRLLPLRRSATAMWCLRQQCRTSTANMRCHDATTEDPRNVGTMIPPPAAMLPLRRCTAPSPVVLGPHHSCVELEVPPPTVG